MLYRFAFVSSQLSAQTALEESERIFTELVCSIERRRAEVKELIRGQERAAVSQAEVLLQQLEQEITELKKRHGELGELSQTEDHIAFLQVMLVAKFRNCFLIQSLWSVLNLSALIKHTMVFSS